MDSHYTTQLRFLADKVERKLEKQYSFINSPACHEVINTQTSTGLGSGRLVKHLGDVSIFFQCSSTTVSPANITESCYKHLPVLDENRYLWYLDPTSRVLLNHGAKTQFIKTWRKNSYHTYLNAPQVGLKRLKSN